MEEIQVGRLMNSVFNLRLFTILSLFTALVVVVSSQSDRPWYTHRWQGSNTPFESAASALKREKPTGSRVNPWIDSYKAQALKNPSDALAQFKYGYATFLVTDRYNDNGRMSYPRERMLSIAPPYTREYVRLLFQIEFFHFKNRNLIAVGRSLLREVPNDNEVMWQLGVLLSQQPDIGSKREGFALTSKAVKANPKHQGLKFTNAMCAYQIYFKSKSKPDARIALNGFQDYLKASTDSKDQKSFRSAAKSYVQELEYVLKH